MSYGVNLGKITGVVLYTFCLMSKWIPGMRLVCYGKSFISVRIHSVREKCMPFVDVSRMSQCFSYSFVSAVFTCENFWLNCLYTAAVFFSKTAFVLQCWNKLWWTVHSRFWLVHLSLCHSCPEELPWKSLICNIISYSYTTTEALSRSMKIISVWQRLIMHLINNSDLIHCTRSHTSTRC